jgi:hypothetical protein
VRILNPGDRLLPEMSATANFLNAARSDAELHEPAKIWISPSSIVDGKVAIVDKESRVRWKSVNTGDKRESRVEITNGLREGDRIVTANADQLKEGQLVRLPEGG